MAATNTVEARLESETLRLLRTLSRPSLLALIVGVLAVFSSIGTYASLTGIVPYKPSDDGLIALLIVNLSLALALGALIAWRLTRLWAARRSGTAGARLHVRLVVIFSGFALVPAILVAVFAAITLNLGIEQWFSAHVKSALESAVNITHSYANENVDLIRNDAVQISDALQHDPQLFDQNSHVNAAFLFTQLHTLTEDHGLQAAYIIDSKGHVLGSTKLRSLPDLPPPSPGVIAQAAHGPVVIDANSNVGVVRALIRMEALNDAYLLVVRTVDKQVFAYYQHTIDAVTEYRRFDQTQSKFQLIFAALYAVVSLLILLAAIWLGLWAANRLIRPISRLISAAERVSEGDLKAQVEVDRDDDEIGLLGSAFNRMTSQLDAQRTELVEASHQIDARRRFTEAVLAGVSAGVIGLDGDGHVTIVNRAAQRLLNAAPEEIEGRHYAEAVPELAGLIRRALQEPIGRSSGEATVKRAGSVRSLSVQVDSEKGEGEAGFIVTFDDITDLVSAQRTSAWADVARRIAHEIKNPLTPIQLSAERLKRKYGGEVTSDPEVFQQCTDTIIRQVGDIGRMVDEFSSFARMPTPVMRRENAQELLHQAVFLQRVACPQITFETSAPSQTVAFECDGRLVSQALTNVLKNATEAIGAREAAGGEEPGRISIALEPGAERVVFRVSDNGIGLPPEHRHRLTEPYVTTRAKGTGLGLAIVRKILEDHGGEIALADRGEEEHGAEVRLSFPLRQKPVRETETGVGDDKKRIADRA
jgi:two-component system, NtrC family, nitrogen regulation sensor histidine kinase NtrY